MTRTRVALSLGTFGLGLLAILSIGVLSRTPGWVETWFVEGWARNVVPPFSRLTGLVPVPLVELLLLAYVGWRGWTLLRGLGRIYRRTASPPGILASGLLIGARDVGIALLLFYGLWGVHYARTPLAERIDLPPVGEWSTEELVDLTSGAVEAANRAYLELHGTEDAGSPTRLSDDWSRLEPALELGWSRAAAVLPASGLLTARFGPPKALLLSPAAAYLGITGIYSPFTAEPLLVGTTPAVSLGLSIAHEQAHQRGITGEGEATLAGFVAALRSDHPLLIYSASVRAQLRLLRLLGRRDRERMVEVATRRLAGVQRDLEDLRVYQLRHRGPTARATARVNDTYLRINRVPGGIESYDEVTELLLRLARAEEEPLFGTIPADAQQPELD